MLGEYGGLGYAVDGHRWTEQNEYLRWLSTTFYTPRSSFWKQKAIEEPLNTCVIRYVFWLHVKLKQYKEFKIFKMHKMLNRVTLAN